MNYSSTNSIVTWVMTSRKIITDYHLKGGEEIEIILERIGSSKTKMDPNLQRYDFDQVENYITSLNGSKKKLDNEDRFHTWITVTREMLSERISESAGPFYNKSVERHLEFIVNEKKITDPEFERYDFNMVECYIYNHFTTMNRDLVEYSRFILSGMFKYPTEESLEENVQFIVLKILDEDPFLFSIQLNNLPGYISNHFGIILESTIAMLSLILYNL